jgi:amino-acid N-acetyltransferase
LSSRPALARDLNKGGLSTAPVADLLDSPGARPRARSARAEDAAAIHALVSRYAAEGLLLPRTLEEIRAHADHFLVLVARGRLLGCVALEPYGDSLAEIRSLGVAQEARGRGMGARLLRYALREARRRGYRRVFAVTHAPEFFAKQGFTPTARQAIPEKIARDCKSCPKEPWCQLVALVATVNAGRAELPILGELASIP